MVFFALILLVLSFLVIASMFLVKFAHVNQRPTVRLKIGATTSHYYETLWPYFKQKFQILVHKIWHFILEAKDLKPATTKTIHTQMENLKKVFHIRIRSSIKEPVWLPEAQDLAIKPNSSHNPEELYIEAIKRNPNDRQAYESLGRLYLQNKNFSEAIEIYEYLTRLDARIDIYFSNLGLAYYSTKDFAKAVSSYEKALNINDKIPTRWINLAFCFEALEQPSKAVKAITKALSLDKLNVNYLTMLADVYTKLNNYLRAEEVLEQILSIEPTNKVAREKLMKIRI